MKKEMILTEDEYIVLHRYRRALEYAKENRQTSIELNILDSGRILTINVSFQERRKIDKSDTSK